MKREDFLDAVGQIDEKYIEEASAVSYGRNLARLKKYSMLAAAVLVLGLCLRFFLPGLIGKGATSSGREGMKQGVQSEAMDAVSGEKAAEEIRQDTASRNMTENQASHISSAASDIKKSDHAATGAPDAPEAAGTEPAEIVDNAHYETEVKPYSLYIETAYGEGTEKKCLILTEINPDEGCRILKHELSGGSGEDKQEKRFDLLSETSDENGTVCLYAMNGEPGDEGESIALLYITYDNGSGSVTDEIPVEYWPADEDSDVMSLAAEILP